MTMNNDIYQHFARKQHLLLHDLASTCEIADIDARETIEMAISILLGELVTASLLMDINEKEFLRLCSTGYRHIKEVRKTGTG